MWFGLFLFMLVYGFYLFIDYYKFDCYFLLLFLMVLLLFFMIKVVW